MPLEQDVEDLKAFVAGLLKLIQSAQVEMQALEHVLVERHGLSLAALAESRAEIQKKLDAIRAKRDPHGQTTTPWPDTPPSREQ